VRGRDLHLELCKRVVQSCGEKLHLLLQLVNKLGLKGRFNSARAATGHPGANAALPEIPEEGFSAFIHHKNIEAEGEGHKMLHSPYFVAGWVCHGQSGKKRSSQGGKGVLQGHKRAITSCKTVVAFRRTGREGCKGDPGLPGIGSGLKQVENRRLNILKKKGS